MLKHDKNKKSKINVFFTSVVLTVVECSRFSDADLATIVHGGVIVGEHIVHQ